MGLVLSRKRMEKIVVNGNIVITVLDISSNHVRLGIDAPADVKVLREEIIHRDGETPGDAR